MQATTGESSGPYPCISIEKKKGRDIYTLSDRKLKHQKLEHNSESDNDSYEDEEDKENQVGRCLVFTSTNNQNNDDQAQITPTPMQASCGESNMQLGFEASEQSESSIERIEET